MLGWCAGLILAVPSLAFAAAAGGGGGAYLLADAAKQQDKTAIRANAALLGGGAPGRTRTNTSVRKPDFEMGRNTQKI